MQIAWQKTFVMYISISSDEEINSTKRIPRKLFTQTVCVPYINLNFSKRKQLKAILYPQTISQIHFSMLRFAFSDPNFFININWNSKSNCSSFLNFTTQFSVSILRPEIITREALPSQMQPSDRFSSTFTPPVWMNKTLETI